MKRLVMVLGALLLAASAEAGLEVRAFTVTGTPDGVISYGYRVRLVSGRLDPASPVSQHVTLYDIPDFIPGSASGTPGWTATEHARGVDADDVPLRNRDDAPRHMNITFEWTGPDVIVAPAELGSISFSVTDAPPSGATVLYVGQCTAGSGAVRPVAVVGRVSGPGAP
ncbi:MAG TPA: hypothetical protein VGQ36_03905 [Thermoanaerobaculia bacterium]|jgi:hypothetical protein|nr:hypothetical protein [Thermoanaerobaculia bacterium]